MSLNWKDVAAGLIFMAIGAFFSFDALSKLQIGTANRMGPGYFPVLLGGVCVALGALIALRSIGKPTSSIGAIPWRGVILIGVAPIAFGAAVSRLGLGPAVALAAVISAFASRRVGLPLALVLSAGLTLFSVLLFYYGLGLPIPVLGPWLGF